MYLTTMRHAFRLTGALLLVTACLLAGSSAAAAGAAEPDTVTVYLVRHAEKDTQSTDNPKDPALTEAGRQRAARLAVILADEPITHLFSTPLRRTRDTLAPLVAERGLEITTIMDVEEQAGALQSLPGGSIAVLAGHSNTVPALIGALGGQVSGTMEGRAGPQLHDDSYDRLFVALLSPAAADGPARLLRLMQLHYGEP